MSTMNNTDLSIKNYVCKRIRHKLKTEYMKAIHAKDEKKKKEIYFLLKRIKHNGI
jgi:hypothetical protein